MLKTIFCVHIPIKTETFCSEFQTKCLILCHNYRRKHMSGMKIYKGEFGKQLELLLAPQIKAGFPSPAQDYMRERALTSMISRVRTRPRNGLT